MSDKGMYCEADDFTDADRLLLRDLQHREKARSVEVLQEVPEGTIVKGRELREIFSFHEDSIGEFRFDVRGIKDAIADGHIRARMYKIPDVPEDYYQHILQNNGVEPDRLPKINGPDLERPGIMVSWPHGYQTMIDGNHRLCRRVQLGMKTFRFLLVDVLDCTRFMCRPGQEAKLFAREDREDVEVLHSEVFVVE